MLYSFKVKSYRRAWRLALPPKLVTSQIVSSPWRPQKTFWRGGSQLALQWWWLTGTHTFVLANTRQLEIGWFREEKTQAWFHASGLGKKKSFISGFKSASQHHRQPSGM